jgi:AcrR family transcriptional regulator
VKAIWDIPETGARGPKPKHDRHAIATAAVRLADEGGLTSVTMRAVAAELGMAPMSLYNYVPAKGHLIQLMVDQVGGEYTYPSPPSDPRAAIVDLARQAREITRRHPWLPDAMRHPATIGPNGLKYLDYFLGLLAGSPLATVAKMEVIALINGFAIMYGGMEATLAAEHGMTAEQHTAAQVATLVNAAATGQYPNLSAVLASAGPADPQDSDATFDSCIRRLLDGVISAS